MADNNSLFDQDRVIWRAMNRMTDVLILSVIFTLTCVPVVTAGAGATALYYVFLKMARGQEGYVVRDFIKSFKLNFVQATIMWLIMLAVGAGLAGGVYYYYEQNTTPATVVMAFFAGVVVIWVLVLLYVFPILSRFSNRTGTLFFMAVFMPFREIGWTIIIFVMAAASAFLGWFVIPYAFIAYGVYAYFSAKVFAKVFRPSEEAIAAKREREQAASESVEEVEETAEAEQEVTGQQEFSEENDS